MHEKPAERRFDWARALLCASCRTMSSLLDESPQKKPPALRGFLDVYDSKAVFGGWKKRFLTVKSQSLLVYDESMAQCLSTLKVRPLLSFSRERASR